MLCAGKFAVPPFLTEQTQAFICILISKEFTTLAQYYLNIVQFYQNKKIHSESFFPAKRRCQPCQSKSAVFPRQRRHYAVNYFSRRLPVSLYPKVYSADICIISISGLYNECIIFLPLKCIVKTRIDLRTGRLPSLACISVRILI